MAEEPSSRSLSQILSEGFTLGGKRVVSERGAREPGPMIKRSPDIRVGATTVRDIETRDGATYLTMCRKKLVPQVLGGRVVRDENGKAVMIADPQNPEGCERRVIPAAVGECTERLTPHILDQTPPDKRTAMTSTGAKVEAFYACAPESYNTFLAAAGTGIDRNFVKQYISSHENPALAVPGRRTFPAFTEGITGDQAAQRLEELRVARQKIIAKREPVPVFEPVLFSKKNKRFGFRDTWGFESYTIPQDVIDAFSQRYCNVQGADVPACRPPSPAPFIRPEEQPQEAE